MTTRSFACFGFCAAMLLLVGCTTWVNIPPQPGDTAIHNPNNANVVKLETAALQAVLKDRPLAQPVHVILPAGTTRATYERVRMNLGPVTDVVYGPQVDATSVLNVQAIRIRALRGEVDIVRTLPGGIPQLVTARMADDLVAGWHLESLRVWRGSMSASSVRPTPQQQAEMVAFLSGQPLTEEVEQQLFEAEVLEAEVLETDEPVLLETLPSQAPPSVQVREVDIVEVTY